MENCSRAFCFWKVFWVVFICWCFLPESFPVLFVCFYFLIYFGCVTPDMFKCRYHLESSGLVNIRCPSAIVFRLQLQRKVSKLQGFFIPSPFTLASATLKFCQALYIGVERAGGCHQTWCLLTLGFYFKLKFLFYLSWLIRMFLICMYRFLFHGTENTRSIQLCLFSPTCY